MVFLAGLLDDSRKDTENAIRKFLFQFGAAALIVFGADFVFSISNTPWIDHLVSFFWVVGITNSFNLLDNMDGLSGGVALFVALALCTLSMEANQTGLAIVLICLAGSYLGFLPLNFHRTHKVFQGDAGAMGAGFILSVIALKLVMVYSTKSATIPAGVTALIFSVPLADTLWVIFYRTINKKKFWIGDNNHLSHILSRSGLKNTKAVLVLWQIAVIAAILALAIAKSQISNT